MLKAFTFTKLSNYIHNQKWHKQVLEKNTTVVGSIHLYWWAQNCVGILETSGAVGPQVS